MPKQTSFQFPAGVDLKKITMEDIYNMLMLEIEPELMSFAIPQLDDLYADETPEEKEERGKRYAAAFAECQKRIKKLMSLWKGEMVTIKKTLTKKNEEKSARAESEELSAIESSIGNA